MADLGGVQADGLDPVQPRLGRLQGLEGVVFAEMAQEAEDQPGGEAVRGLGARHRGQQALHHHGHRDAASGMSLRIEEDLRVRHRVSRGAVEIGAGEVVKVFGRPQHSGALIVEVEEVLQIAEVVGRAHRLDAGEGDRKPVSPSQGEHHLRLETALDMDMQLGLRQAGDEGVRVHHPVMCRAGRQGKATCRRTLACASRRRLCGLPWRRRWRRRCGCCRPRSGAAAPCRCFPAT